MKKLLLTLFTVVCAVSSSWAVEDIALTRTWKIKSFGDLVAGDVVIIANNFGNALKSNQTVTKSAANIDITATKSNDEYKISYTGATKLNDLAWTVDNGTNGKKFYVYGSNNNLLYLAKTNDNNALGIGEGKSNTEWVMGTAGKLLLNYGNGRYCGKYVSGSDWRTYSSETANNYKSGSTEQSLVFYVLQSGSDTRTAVTLTWSEATATATVGEQFSAPTLSVSPLDVTGITYSSSNTSVADINSSTGVVTIKAQGTTTITASFAGDETYKSASADYVLTVNKPVRGNVTYTLVSKVSDIHPTDDVIIVWEKEGFHYAITNANGTSKAPSAVTMSVSDNTITTNTENIVWNINYNHNDDTFMIYPLGLTSTYLYCTNTNDGVRVGKGDAKTFKIRDEYLYTSETSSPRYLGIYNENDVRCYTSINSNITGETLKFFVKKTDSPAVPETVSFVATDGDSFYATFSCNHDVIFDVNDNIEVFAVCADGSSLTLEEFDKTSTVYTTDEDVVTGYYVPANTGVLLYSLDQSVDYKYVLDDDDNDLKDVPEGNNLYPASINKTTIHNHKFYMLAYSDNTCDPSSLGFYWGAADGAAFTSREGSAYLAIPANVTLARGFVFNDGVTTGVKNVQSISNSSIAYNLVGQRVAANTKGIVIINGKKYIK